MYAWNTDKFIHVLLIIILYLIDYHTFFSVLNINIYLLFDLHFENYFTPPPFLPMTPSMYVHHHGRVSNIQYTFGNNYLNSTTHSVYTDTKQWLELFWFFFFLWYYSATTHKIYGFLNTFRRRRRSALTAIKEDSRRIWI